MPQISIHALRVEGDMRRSSPEHSTDKHFYPRPPGGGRPGVILYCNSMSTFLSTPSGWRATAKRIVDTLVKKNFYPRPPGGGRLHLLSPPLAFPRISIHALRVEGDGIDMDTIVGYVQFLSTPSGWRATKQRRKTRRRMRFLSTPSGWRATFKIKYAEARAWISIHALRVEGDFRSLAKGEGKQ